MEMIRRRRRIGEMLLRGISNQDEMASAFDVDAKTIKKDVQYIHEKWLSEGVDDLDTRRRIRVKQLDSLMTLAINAFERSKKPKRESYIEQRPCDNPKCRSGLVQTDSGQTECGRCHGQEWYTVEREKVSQSGGDPAYLAVARAAVVEAARIEGVYPAIASAMRRTVESALVNANGEHVGTMREMTEELTYEAPYEVIVKAMAALEDCRVHASLPAPVEDMPPPVDHKALPRKRKRQKE